METKRDTLWKYAPVWAILFASGATLAKSLGTNYILKRKWEFEWSDMATALGGAAVGYLSFRFRYGNKDKSTVLTR